jgi:ribosomal protein S18 acetylase RimI-like enzyme
MADITKISADNWDNLMELYMDIYRNSDGHNQTSCPISSGLSNTFGWPNFSILANLERDLDSFLSNISEGIDQGMLAPMILVHPELHNHNQITTIFEKNNIRQIGQWPLMYYDLNSSLPDYPMPNNFKIVYVDTKERLADWQQVASHVLFNDKSIPLSYLDTEKHALFVGYENGLPAATVSVFFAEEYSSAHMVAVLPEYRNRGYGKLIMRAALKISAERGYMRCFCQSSKMGLKSWLALGYKISGYVDIFWKIGNPI